MMKNISKFKAWLPLIAACAFALGLLSGFFIYRQPSLSPAQKKFNNIIETISSQYVDDISIDSLIERTIPYLVSNLDPHSNYIPAKDLSAVNGELEGTFSGVGVSFSIMNDTICIVEIISGGPSEKVGLQAGDRIVTIDDKNVSGIGITNEQVFSKLRGVKGTEVKIGIKRANSSKILSYKIVRDDIPVTSIDAAYLVDKNIGYVKVNKFARNTYDEFISALNKLRVSGAEKYIIDLRGNGGGFMEPAILMANEFLQPYSTIVETRGRIKENNSGVMSDATGSFHDAEVIVVIDEYSASASEIFSGALQDNDRALIVGRRSFGKGLVQQQIVLPDSSALRLTIQRYYTPSGRCIQKDYTSGQNATYESELIDRYNHGEAFNADSIKLKKNEIYKTANGRIVYGGGGIVPDVFVPNDTSGITRDYINIANAGLIQKFSYEYSDLNRNELSKCKTVNEILKKIPNDDVLIESFVNYCRQNGVRARWYYVNISRTLILSQLKSLIARDILGSEAFYQIYNLYDTSIIEAIRQMKQGNAQVPIQDLNNKKQVSSKRASLLYRPKGLLHHYNSGDGMINRG
jgi:carboxyl-terminal processing protease